MRSAAKVLKFPLSGIARDVDYRKAYIPDEERTFATPFALNVRGSDTFHRRNRGGSRPGLKRIDVTGLTVNNPHFHPTISGFTGANSYRSCIYRGRAVFTADNCWHMSAIGDHSLWNFGGDKDDPSRAVMGNLALATKAGEFITAAIPIKDDCIYFATDHSLWVLTGDPIGGQFKCVSEHVGCVTPDSWAYDGTRLWLLSNQGLYVLNVGENVPIKASHHIPEELLGMKDALLVYDGEENALHIFAKTDNCVTDIYFDYFYDIEQKAFWKMSFKSTHRPKEVGYTEDGFVTKPIFKGGDDVWRVFDDEQTTDDGEVINSKVAIGPIRTSARDDIDGMVAEVEGILAKGSVNVDLDIYTAHSPEEVVEIAEIASGTPSALVLKAGWNNVCRPRQRGAWAIFVASSTGRWGYESVTTIMKSLGRLR